MIKLVWLVAFVGAQGPQVLPIGETTTFPDQAACEAFGERMTTRLADYARGIAHLDWSDPVHVGFRCAINGQPA